MQHLYALFFCVMVSGALAQTRTVQVCFFEGKQPIPGVVVQGEGIVPATADAKGCVQIAISSNQSVQLHCSLMGYVSKKVMVGPQETQLQILLEPNITMLQTVVVSAGKFEQRVEETTVSLDVIEPYLVQAKNPLDIRSTFEQSPGINVTDGQANIRGGSGWSYGTGTRVLVLVDDMPMISADANQVQWQLIPFEALQQMEVIKGASSALYGTSALNGIVNIRTLDAKDAPSLQLNLFQGVYTPPSQFALDNRTRGVSGATFSYAEKINRTGLVISGNFLNDDGYAYDQYERRGRLHAKLDHDFKAVPGLRAGVTANVMNRGVSNTLLWQGYDQPYIPLDSNATLTEGWDFYIDPRLTYQRRQHKHTYKGRYLEVNNNARSPTQNFENYSKLFYHEYQFQQFLNETFVLTAGGVASFGNSESALFRGVYNTTNYAGYAQADIKYKKLAASAGWRYEFFQINDRTFQRPVFRAGLNAQLAKASFIRASYGGGFRFPSIAELHTFTNVGTIFVYPNPDLEPESGYSAEIGFKQGLQLGPKWKGFLDVAGYLMAYNNMMEFSFAQWNQPTLTDLGIGFRSINVGPTNIAGAEITFTGQGQIGAMDVRILAGYNYSLPTALAPDSVYATNYRGEPVTYLNSSSNPSNNILKYRYQHIAKTDVQVDYKRFTAGASVRYNSFMQNIDEIFEGNIIDVLLPGVGIKESRLDTQSGDWIFDLRIGYKITDELKCSIIANNLTNRIYFPRPAMIGPPRMWMFQLNYGF